MSMTDRSDASSTIRAMQDLTLAMARQAGPLHGALVSDALRELSASGHGLHEFAVRQLDDLAAGDAITPDARALLGELFEALADESTVEKAKARVDDAYRRLVELDPPSPVAVLVASVGADSLNTIAREKGEKKGVGLADAAGAAAGAKAGMGTGTVGGLLGSLFGALVGGFALGIAFSVVAKRDQSTENQ
jgi:hypothetical protein